MTLTSWVFGLFLIITVSVYWLLPARWKSFFLLGSSFIFAAYAAPTHALLLLSISTFVYMVAEYVRGRKGILILAVAVPVIILGYFKYQGFLAEIFKRGSSWLPVLPTIDVPALVVPLGISFFTFKLIHYVVDSYWGVRPKGSYRQFLLYIFFFPILPSGPIERWPDFYQQNQNLPAFRWDHVSEGFSRIILGLFKKLVLADNLALYAAQLHTPGHSGLVYWVAAYAYALQIYFDFSGYTDLAIGSARMFGYRIMENFNNPYLKRNLSQFWKNWHISLTSWFRDYVFIPLGGSRVSFCLVVVNTFIVMGLTGLWHGAALHFIAWGLYHGAGLIVLRIYDQMVFCKLPHNWQVSKSMAGISTVVTFHFVVIGWVFFATDFSQSIHVIKKLLIIF